MNNPRMELNIFKALSDENRIKILLLIQHAESSQACSSSSCDPREACVTNLAETLGISAATTSHHIKELINAGLITTVKRGRWVYCTVNHKTFSQMSDFLNQFKEVS